MNFIDKITQKPKVNVDNLFSGDVEEGKNNIEFVEKSPFYAAENVRNQPSCLDLRLSNGKFIALPYAYFVEISYSPSDGIEIVSSTKKAVITGRNLRTLYNYLAAYRIKYIQSNMGNDLTDAKTLFVKEIRIEDV